MSTAASMMFVSELEQCAGAAVVVLLLVTFYRGYRKGYLLHWIWSWIALTLLHAGSALLLQAEGRGEMLFTSVAVNLAGYLQVATFLLGAAELSTHRPTRISTQRGILLAVSVGALLVAMTTSLDVQAAVRLVLAGFGSMAAGYYIWRHRGIRGAPGFILFSVMLVGYGALQFQRLLFVGTGQLAESVRDSLVRSSETVTLVLQLCLGLCIVVCVLDDEREGAVLAASEIERLAYHDALTGLPNRALFFDRLMLSLAQASRELRGCAVLFVDLDRFKEINDSLGHSVGDVLLKAAAKRISDCLRQGDTLCRFGGDEFTILIPRIERPDDVVIIAEKILHAVRVPFVLAGREMVVTASIGISIFPEDGIDAESLVKNADSAMYRAKEQGRDNYQLYAPAMNSKALANLDLENRLRKALDQKELVMHYQPIVDRTTMTVCGVEGLLRWQHPDLGLLSPDHFMVVAERSGVILPIGGWVLRRACTDGRAIQRAIGRDIVIGVNISARQLYQLSLVDDIRAALAESGLDPECLELEITETNAMQNIGHSIRVLRELKNIGVRLAIDDFGTGYSSLNYLAELPIDTIKLDRAFVRDIGRPGGGTIALAVIEMAHALRMKVTAEGVEDEAQLTFLTRNRCDRLQGYLFGKAIEMSKLTALVASLDSGESWHIPSVLRMEGDERTH